MLSRSLNTKEWVCSILSVHWPLILHTNYGKVGNRKYKIRDDGVLITEVAFLDACCLPLHSQQHDVRVSMPHEQRMLLQPHSGLAKQRPELWDVCRVRNRVEWRRLRQRIDAVLQRRLDAPHYAQQLAGM